MDRGAKPDIRPAFSSRQIGAALARMEAEVAWRTLFARFPDPAAWRIAGEPVPNPGRMIHGLRSLPVQVSSRVPV